MISLHLSEQKYAIVRLNELCSAEEITIIQQLIQNFSWANKLIQVQKSAISKSILKRLLRTAEDTGGDVITIPAILVAQLGKNYAHNHSLSITGESLLSIIHYFIQEVQNLIGGSVYFLECDSDRQKVIDFYERNNFVLFSERYAKTNEIQLLQFMKKI